MKISRHRLHFDDGTPVRFRRSPNQSEDLSPEFLVIHYTAGADAESSISWLTNPASGSSAHVVIGRDASVTQLVPFDRRAWHAGASRWRERRGLNAWSFGIELDNAGLLAKRGGSWTSPFGQRIEDSQVALWTPPGGGAEQGWHAYGEQQLRVAAEVSVALARHYGITEVLGHEEIAPGRKTDPGPAFPMPTFRARVLGRRGDDAPVALVQTTTSLHIRTGPGAHFDKLPVSPLPAGAKLELLGESGSWRQVLCLDLVAGEMDVEGWVHGRYLAPLG